MARSQPGRECECDVQDNCQEERRSERSDAPHEFRAAIPSFPIEPEPERAGHEREERDAASVPVTDEENADGEERDARY